VAALHEYLAGLRSQVNADLGSLRAAAGKSRTELAGEVQGGLQQLREVEGRESEAKQQALTAEQEQDLAVISADLPAGDERLVRDALAVYGAFIRAGSEQTGVWEERAAGQLKLSGTDPAWLGIGGRLRDVTRERRRIGRQIDRMSLMRNIQGQAPLFRRLNQLAEDQAKLEKAAELRTQFFAAAKRRAQQAAGHEAQIEKEAAEALKVPSQVSPSAVQLDAVMIKADQVAGQESAQEQTARWRAGFLANAQALHQAMTTIEAAGAAVRDGRQLSRAERKQLAKARTVAHIQQSFLATWRMTGPSQIPRPPQTTITTWGYVLDAKGRRVGVTKTTTHPDVTGSPVTTSNPFEWAGIHLEQDANRGQDYRVFRYPPYSVLSWVWSLGGTLPVMVNQTDMFTGFLPYLGTRYRITRRADHLDVRLRSVTEMLRYGFPSIPGQPGFSVELGEGWTVSGGLYYYGQFGTLAPGSDDLYVDNITGQGREKTRVSRLLAKNAAADGRPVTWTLSTTGGELALSTRNPGPRFAPQLKAATGFQILISKGMTHDHLASVWNGLTDLIFAITGHHVPRLPIMGAHATPVGSVGLVIQAQVTPESKLQVTIQRGDPRAKRTEWELNTGAEIVVGLYVAAGDPNITGFTASAVPGNFVVGHSLSNFQDLAGLADKIAAALGLNGRDRAQLRQQLGDLLAQAEQRARAATAAQQLAATWDPAATHPAARNAGSQLAAAGLPVTTTGGTVRLNATTYYVISPATAATNKIASKIAARWAQLTQAGLAGRTGLIIMGHLPVDVTQLRAALARLGAKGTALPANLIYISPDGSITDLSGPAAQAAAGTIAAAQQLAVHGEQVAISGAATSTGHDVITISGQPYVLYTPPAAATATQIAEGALAALDGAGTTAHPATRPRLLINLTGNTSGVTPADLIPALAPHAADLPGGITVLGADGTPHTVPQAFLDQAYPALQTHQGVTYTVAQLSVRHGKHLIRARIPRSRTLQLSRQITQAVHSYQTAITTTPGRNITGIQLSLEHIPGATTLTATVIKLLTNALTNPGTVLPNEIRLTFPDGSQRRYQVTQTGQQVQLHPITPQSRNHRPTTATHLQPTWVPGFDLYPLESIDTKTHWLGRAADENWLCGFGHDTAIAFTQIARDPKTSFAVGQHA
jgi:hypothetical protein